MHDQPMNKRKNPNAVRLGRAGGKKGGHARAASMTEDEKSESARRAAQVRWGKTPDAESKDTGSELVAFDFHGDALECIPRDGKLWVVVRTVCNSLGLNADGQRVKLQSKAWAGTEMISVPSPGGVQQTFCIDLDSLPMWLATIEASRVSPDVQPKLERYQLEVARVLRDHFLGSRVPEPPEATRTPAEILLGMAQQLVDQERRQKELEQRQFDVENKVGQLASGQSALEADVVQLRSEIGQRGKKTTPKVIEINEHNAVLIQRVDSDDDPEFVQWTKTIEGALSGAQSLALAQIAALQKLRLGFLAPLAIAAKALETGNREAAESAIASAVKATETHEKLAVQQLLLVGLTEARRLISVAYRCAYVGYATGPGRIPWSTPISLSHLITPTHYPLRIVFVNAEGLDISGPIFVDPDHARAQVSHVPKSAGEWLRAYNTHKARISRAKRGLTIRPGHKGRAPKS